MSADAQLFDIAGLAFGPRFLQDHVGHIMTDPRIAIVELVANAYDAGATEVGVTWPLASDQEFAVADNGTGLTSDELERRWRTLSYSRASEQGQMVEFPADAPSGLRRTAFGQNGKGRFAPFCFSDAYKVETRKNGRSVTVRVSVSSGGSEPFGLLELAQGRADGHGTTVSGVLKKEPLPVSAVAEAIGSKFLVDPNFRITVNGEPLELLDLRGVETTVVSVNQVGEITIHQINALQQDRTTLLRGITWWVGRRMVGTPSWEGLDGHGAILDGRRALAKRLSFVVEADVLRESVAADWTRFKESEKWAAVRSAVHDHVTRSLGEAMADTHLERKREATIASRDTLAILPVASRRVFGQFVDQVQANCPSLTPGDLVRTAQVFAKMEAARSGYSLLQKLAACSPADIDTWDRLMQEWSASAAEVVLSELRRRLELIEKLQALVAAKQADELHELQPLFAKGLWIFGPEYESVEFTSNRAMVTVVSRLLGGAVEELTARRPDFVALPDRSVSCFSANGYDESGEVNGIRKVLVVELKRGGFCIGTQELRQGEDYAVELSSANGVGPRTEMVVYVLGSSLADSATELRKVGDYKRIVPMTYDVILNRAHARTFGLQRRLEEMGETLVPDAEIERTLVGADDLVDQASA